MRMFRTISIISRPMVKATKKDASPDGSAS
jgi:hypothetical protein